MACDDLRAAVVALQDQYAALETQIEDTPAPERDAARRAAQPQLNAINAQIITASTALNNCMAALSPPQPTILAPQAILETAYNNPAFDTSSPTWAKDLVGGNTFLGFPDSSAFEWTQVLDPNSEYEVQFVGASGWVIVPDFSGADNPFAHPFGTDWEFYLAPDPPYQSLAAPTTNDLYAYAATIAKDRGLQIDNCLGVEIEQGLVPAPWKLQDGDRVCVWGRWIVDAGHDDFHTEIHPPAVLVGARLAPGTDSADPGTFTSIVSRPYLVSQVFSDGHALEAHLLEEVAKLTHFLSTRLEAHPVIMPKPFSGVNLMSYTVRPPTGRQSPADRLMVGMTFTVKTGVAVEVTNIGDAVTVYVVMNDAGYQPPLLPEKTEVSITLSKMEELNPEAKSAFEDVIFASLLVDPLAPVLEVQGILTDTYAAPTPPFDRPPTVVDVTALPANTPVVVDDSQPFPIIGFLTLNWQRASVWESLGGLTQGDVSAVSWGAGRLDLFVRGMDNIIYHKYFDSAWGPSMTDWESLGGVTPGDVTAVSWAAGRLDVFVRGMDNVIYHKWFENTWGPSMTDWESLGGLTEGDVTAVSWGAGRLDVFVRGTDNVIYHKWFDGTAWGPSMTGWESLGGSTEGDVTAVSWGAGRLDVFVRGTDNVIYHKWFDGTAWGPSMTDWQSIGGSTPNDVSAVSWGPGRLDAFVRGTDNVIYHATV